MDMNFYPTFFHILLAISSNEVVLIETGTLTESEIHQLNSETVDPKQEKSKSSDEHIRFTKTELDSDRGLEPHVQEPDHSETEPSDLSIEKSKGMHSTGYLCQREKNGREVLLITPKTCEIDSFSKIEERNNIDLKSLGVLKKVTLRNSAVLLECDSKERADTLRKIISEFQELSVEPTHFCEHIMSIHDLPREVTREELNSIIFAKYKIFPNQIYFVPYAPGWKEDVNIALVDVNDTLLVQIEKYQVIPIHWMQYIINVLLEIPIKSKSWDSDSSHREMNNYPRNLIEIKNISKFSVARKNAAKRDISIINYRHKVNRIRTWTEFMELSREGGSFRHFRTIDRENEEISKARSEYVQKILAEILPSALESILKTVDISIDNTLANLVPSSERAH